ncbi:vWA domain-containing protein [Herbaspirillum seropedicae]|uniref:vWA domain-containing protein n=1 Tax=Herbaspirillum seropedicae TaxID=964 RepID=UPI003F8D333A
MANIQLFKSLKRRLLPAADTMNYCGASAYALSKEHRLAQYAATGCLNHTFYASAQAQLATVLELSQEIAPRFIAQTALYARRRSYMKDMPALLLAVLAARGAEELVPAFEGTVDNGKMLRNFVQILRSGVTGRKSLGSRPKKLVQAWLNQATEEQLLHACVGQSPSLADVVKMVHPKPAEPWRAAFFAWLIGRPYDHAALPPLTRALCAYQRDRAQPIPQVPFQLLTAMQPGTEEWTQMARDGGWHMVRMNLNSFARHGVFEVPGMTELIAARLCDASAIAKARVFPYQLMAAWKACDETVPVAVREALQKAMEIALANVPTLEGTVVICPDVSGSMSNPISGVRAGASSAVRCIDVAALLAAAILRKNGQSRVLPFDHRMVSCPLDPSDTVMVNAARLARIGGGGTDCSAPLRWLNEHGQRADLVILVSDNESWLRNHTSGATETLRQWQQFKQRNRKARLVCVDLAPHASSQAPESDDILNIGGFSDDVFRLLASFAAGQMQPQHWVDEIASMPL